MVQSENTEQPFFSVIIPTHARPRMLETCLAAMMDLDYPKTRFEVIVVDDGSPQSLSGVVDPFQSTIAVSLVEQDNAGPAEARNTGAAQAQGRFLAFTDDDCLPNPDWLQVLSSTLSQHPDHLIGGRTLNMLADNVYATASQMLIDFLYENYVYEPNNPRFFTSNNMALSAELFHQIGGFDSSFPQAAGEDRDFCDRWHLNGYQLMYEDKAIVRHYRDMTPASFWRQHVNYGRGAHRFHKLFASRHINTVAVESPTFYARLVAYPLSTQQSRLQKPILVGLMLVAQIANLFGYLSSQFGD